MSLKALWLIEGGLCDKGMMSHNRKSTPWCDITKRENPMLILRDFGMGVLEGWVGSWCHFCSNMPFLFVGFALGAVATHMLRTFINRGTSPAAPTVGAEYVSSNELWADMPMQSLYDRKNPLKKICRFANYSNNCWMNATLQATLNLAVVQKKLPQKVQQFVTLLPQMPAFVCLYLSALENPGKCFTSAELCIGLEELCHNVPSLILYKSNDAMDFLMPLLSWFDQCGIQTSIRLRDVNKCPGCDFTTSSVTDLGSIVSLPKPLNGETLNSLIKRGTGGTGGGRKRCKLCGRKMVRRQFWTHPDILTFFVNRISSDGLVSHDRVYSPEQLEMDVDENTKQTYRLSSVICHAGMDRHTGHFWSYLFADDITIEASDTYLSFTSQGPPDKVYNNGTTYLYEI